MKLVREYIEFKQMNFERNSPPKEKLDIGEKHRIEAWLLEHGFELDEFRINDDFTIDILDDANLIGYDLMELPEFINFNTIYGGFYAGGNQWQSLRGFPKVINGDLQLSSPSAPGKNNREIAEEMIRKIIKVNGQIYLS